MTLEQYRQMRGLTYQALADELSAATGRRFSKGTVRNYCVAAVTATHHTMHLVWLASGGAVEPNDWFDLDPALIRDQASGIEDQGSGIRDQNAEAPQPQTMGEAA